MILLGGIPTPLKNDGVRSSVGMMTFHSHQYITGIMGTSMGIS
jgi:hypothetical protein